LILTVAAVLALATYVGAGQAVYYDGQVWNAFSSQSITYAGNASVTSSAHALIYNNAAAADGSPYAYLGVNQTGGMESVMFPEPISFTAGVYATLEPADGQGRACLIMYTQ